MTGNKVLPNILPLKVKGWSQVPNEVYERINEMRSILPEVFMTKTEDSEEHSPVESKLLGTRDV